MTRRHRRGWGVGKEALERRRRWRGDVGEKEELARKRRLCDRAVATTVGLEIGV